MIQPPSAADFFLNLRYMLKTNNVKRNYQLPADWVHMVFFDGGTYNGKR